MYPIQLLTGNLSLTSLLTATPQQTINLRGSILLPSCFERPTVVAHSTETKWPHSLPIHDMGLDQSGDKPILCPKEPTPQR